MVYESPLGTARRRLRRGPPLAIGDFVFTPVVVEERAAGTTRCGPWLFAAKRPVAVIVTSPSGRRLVRLDQETPAWSGTASESTV